MAPPAPAGSNADGSSAAVVCCMCGDHGLPGELFRCGLCLHRLQHRYCSDMYPRVAAYRACNWCLRDDEGGGGSPVKAPPPMTTTAEQREPARLTDSRDHIHGGGGGGDDRSCGGSGGGCSRSAFPAGPGKAVKKPKKSHEGPAALRSVTTTTTATTRRKPLSRAKARVQRYKLLAEVIISC